MENKRRLLQIDITSEENFAFNSVIENAIEATIKFVGSNASEISVLIVNKTKMQGLNAKYRDKDYATDVLSFPQDDNILGDIVICLEKALEQAEEFGHSIERELAFLAVHGCLHLLGYDHELGEAQEKEMFAMQDAIMELLKGLV